MKYKIENFSDLEIIMITINGTLDQEMRKELHLKVVNDLTVNGYDRLLIDVCNSTLSHDFSTSDSIDMAIYMQQFAMHGNTKIAFLCAGEEDARKNFVNTAQLIGINIEYFINQDEAIEWLCKHDVTSFNKEYSSK